MAFRALLWSAVAWEGAGKQDMVQVRCGVGRPDRARRGTSALVFLGPAGHGDSRPVLAAAGAEPVARAAHLCEDLSLFHKAAVAAMDELRERKPCPSRRATRECW